MQDLGDAARACPHSIEELDNRNPCPCGILWGLHEQSGSYWPIEIIPDPMIEFELD